VRDELPHTSTEQVGQELQNGRLEAADFLNEVGDAAGVP